MVIPFQDFTTQIWGKYGANMGNFAHILKGRGEFCFECVETPLWDDTTAGFSPVQNKIHGRAVPET